MPYHTPHGSARRGQKTRTYNAWIEMRRRCYTPTCDCYDRYGGRGIKVCERWDRFENFLADMGECPEGLTLERKDTDGDYGPDNCVWDTWENQKLNRSTTKWIEYNGERLHLRGWAARLGISQPLLTYRFKKGMTVQQAFETPVGKQGKRS